MIVTNSQDFNNIKLITQAGTEVKAEDKVMSLQTKEKVASK